MLFLSAQRSQDAQNAFLDSLEVFSRKKGYVTTNIPFKAILALLKGGVFEALDLPVIRKSGIGQKSPY